MDLGGTTKPCRNRGKLGFSLQSAVFNVVFILCLGVGEVKGVSLLLIQLMKCNVDYELHKYSSFPQILLAYLETAEQRLLDLAAHLLGSRSLQALSALVVEAWHLKALGSPVQTKQVLC